MLEVTRSRLNSKTETTLPTVESDGLILKFCKQKVQIDRLGLSDGISIKECPEYGRYIYANRNMDAGEIVLVEKAFASAIYHKHYSSYCDNCFSELSIRFDPCDNCRLAVYCNRTCLAQAWTKHHRVECSFLERHVHSVVSEVKHLCLRAAIAQSQVVDKGISSLEGHVDRRTSKDIFWKTCVALYLCRLVQRVEPEWSHGALILSHLISFPCNAHEIVFFYPKFASSCYNFSPIDGDKTVECGPAIYYYLSMFNHSCDPTVTRNFYRDYVISRTIKSVRKGQQLFDQYSCLYHAQTRSDITEIKHQQ